MSVVNPLHRPLVSYDTDDQQQRAVHFVHALAGASRARLLNKKFLHHAPAAARELSRDETTKVRRVVLRGNVLPFHAGEVFNFLRAARISLGNP